MSKVPTKFTTESYIKVCTDFRGFHQWLGAPDEVAFLRDLHRHTFYVEVAIPVQHHDRDLEFFLVQRQIDTILAGLYRVQGTTGNVEGYNLGERSCEMIATELGNQLFDDYPQVNELTISVSEDNENFGIVKLTRVEGNTGMIELRGEKDQ